MTVPELLRRVAASDPVTVLNTIANDPEEAKAFALDIGPWALQELLRATRHKTGLVAPTSSGKDLAPRGEWTLREWKRRLAWLMLFASGVNREVAFTRRVVQAFGSNTTLASTSRELRAKLRKEDAAHLDALCGRKRLAA